MGVIRIGTSGFHYPHWRQGVFYPRGLPQREELRYYATQFGTVELNNPFYRLPSREQFAAWASQTPGDFVFAVKASRYISHLKRLLDCEHASARFLDAARGLGQKLGVVLCQLPPTFELDLKRLAGFLKLLPAGAPWVMEFRHPSWLTGKVLQILQEREAGFCVAVGGRLREEAVAATGPVAYLRFHAGRGTQGRFTRTELSRWASEIQALAVPQGRTVFVYFNNDAYGWAPRNAAELRELLNAS